MWAITCQLRNYLPKVVAKLESKRRIVTGPRPESLDAVDRERLELYITASQDDLPWWYFPTLALATAAMIATFDIGSPWVTIGAVLVLGGVIGVSVRTVEHRAGFSPRIPAMPPSMRTRLYGYLAGHMIVVLGVLGYAAIGSDHDWRFTIAGIVCGLVLWLGAVLFQRRYRAHARDLAHRAGIDLG